jgi:hypothetical protein
VLLASAGVASAQVLVDGFEVTFNPLPASDVTSGLIPTNLSSGANFYYFDGIGSLQSSGHYWGQTNAFTYSPTLNGSAFDGIYNGSATYDYSTPQTEFSILWGSVDYDNSLSLYNGNTLLGTITGSDLVSAVSGASLSSSQVYNGGGGQPYVDISIPVPSTYTSAVVYGAPDLTFEYSNIETVPIAAPEPGALALLLPAVALPLARLRRRRETPA